MARNLAQRLVADLRRKIVEGHIAVGERLPSESTLIDEYGVSRTVVREAISQLQAQGLVRTRRGSGSYALTPPPVHSPSSLVAAPRTVGERLQFLEFRAALETRAASLAALAVARDDSRAQDVLPLLEAALADFTAAGDDASAALAADFEFHRLLAEASGNRYFSDAVQALGAPMIAMPKSRLGEPAGDGRAGQATVEHRAILHAVSEGDPVAAAAAMQNHLDHSRRRLDTGG